MRLRSRSGIALFILMTSVVVISLLMKEVIQQTTSQAFRVKNYGDRIQAVYLARSALSIARFLLLFDQFLDGQGKDNKSDTLNDVWAQPAPFPVPTEIIQEFAKTLGGTESAPEADPAEMAKKAASCNAFFEDFNGTAISTTRDLSSRFNINNFVTTDQITHDVFKDILSPNYQFLDALNTRHIDRETLIRQIRDYIDRDEIDNDTNASEMVDYQGRGMKVGPKQRPMVVIDELKMIPLMDDELFEYLQPLVRAYNITTAQGDALPAKINLNTTSQILFQALLKEVSNPEEVAENFIKDRKENSRIYKDGDLAATLQQVLGLSSDNLRTAMMTGNSSLFEVETHSEVSDIGLTLTTVISRVKNAQSRNPIVFMRTSP